MHMEGTTESHIVSVTTGLQQRTSGPEAGATMMPSGLRAPVQAKKRTGQHSKQQQFTGNMKTLD